jgi:quinol monooxygenase YgiN
MNQPTGTGPLPNEAPREDQVTHVLIIHEVADYAAWKGIFDGAAGIRKEGGEMSYQVLRYADDAKKVVHFSTWDSLGNAKAFFESPRLVKIREEAGVIAPEFIYLDLLEAGVL